MQNCCSRNIGNRASGHSIAVGYRTYLGEMLGHFDLHALVSWFLSIKKQVNCDLDHEKLDLRLCNDIEDFLDGNLINRSCFS